GQQSQTRSSISDSVSCCPPASNVAARTLMLSFSGSAVARPSSQITPTPASRVGKSVANPCCVVVPSWCGDTGAAHVAPLSFDHDILMSYASRCTSVFCSQCATSVRSSTRTTDGTSAELTNQSLPDATLRGSVQPFAARSANFSVARAGAGSAAVVSTQLTIAACRTADRFGSELPAGAASSRG